MLYTSADLFIAEIISVISGFATYQLLAKKNKIGWICYLISSLTLVYIFYFKASWVSFFNQSMMGVLGIKNYYLFPNPESMWHGIFHKAAVGVFIFSLFFVNGLNGKSLNEVILWIIIIGKTVYLGKKNLSGWYLQILQQLTSIIFGWYQGIYVYVLKSIVFAIQAVFGLQAWKKSQKQLTPP